MDLIFLHGPPASGKLTVARALEILVGYPVFHNHLVVDAVDAVFAFGSEPFVRLREQFWMQIFVEAAQADRSLTFTFAPEPTVPSGFPARVRNGVEHHGGRVCFVQLTVGDAEQERRISADSRRAFHKLTDVTALRQLRATWVGVEQPPVDLLVDTEAFPAKQTAALIAENFGLTTRGSAERHPNPL